MRTDFLIIGSGLAGLFAALKLAPYGSVAVVTKREIEAGTTANAQGGMAAVQSSEDSIASHVNDTLQAGGGLCEKKVVEKVVGDGPKILQALLRLGVDFTKNRRGELDLAREGGHSRSRIVHAQDITGSAIQNALVNHCRANANITLLENQMAVDLVTQRHLPKNKKGEKKECFGAYVLNTETNTVVLMEAKATILATGGAGKVYRYTSNPDAATGDGMALALRAGCTLANMEFVQFHPTCLYSAEAKTFLISEALRGEGALLKLKNGELFMKRYDPRGELATRDIVARAIDFELKKSGDPYVLLDISHKPSAWIKERFPNIYQTCLRYGMDITKQPIPVVPAAHYFCGGVVTNIRGETELPRLYACGEVSFTGLHGANRLASNSLLEAACFADYAVQSALRRFKENSFNESVRPWNDFGTTDSDEEVIITQNWDEIRAFMWNYVGIVRSDKRLERAKHRIQLLLQEIDDYYWNFKINRDLLELRNLSLVADAIITSALSRKESRGLHYNINYPETSRTFEKPTFFRDKR